MISKVIFVAVFSVLYQQPQQARGATTCCEYEIEYSGRDPEYVLTEVRRSAYRQYEEVKRELETAELGGDASADGERRSLLDALETARYELDEYLNELNTATVGRMRAAYAEYGHGDGYARAVDEIRADAEAQLGPRLTVFRESCSRPPSSLVDGVLSGAGSLLRGLAGGLTAGRLL